MSHNICIYIFARIHMPVIYLARIHICTVSLRSIKNIYIARIHVPVIYCTYTYALPIVYIRTYTCALISARIHVHVMWCVYICVCMCWDPVNMPGCGRDGALSHMMWLWPDHRLSHHPCICLHEVYMKFTWSLQYCDWWKKANLVWRAVFAVINLCQYLQLCHKALKLYPFTKSFIKIISAEKKTLLNPY